MVKGPLSKEQLAGVASLYGSHDSKYLRHDFVSQLFNRNQLGFSLHALVEDEGRVVAHYALIPLMLLRGGKEVLGAKGEALVIHADYRRRVVSFGRRKRKLGFELPRQLYEFGLEQGIKVMVMIAPKDVGVLHRKAGATGVLLQGCAWTWFLSNPVSARSSTPKRILGAVLPSLQKGYSLCASRFLFAVSRYSRCDVHDIHEVGTNAPLPCSRWAISRTQEVLAWYEHIGLRKLVVENATGRHAIYYYVDPRKPEYLEVIDWSLADGSLSTLLLLMLAVGEKARKDNVKRVVYLEWDADSENSLLYRKVARILGLISHRREIDLYIRSDDPFYLRREHLQFHPLFYATF